MRSHKTLLAWQRAHSVVLLVLDICKHRWHVSAAAVFSQLQRSALSVQLNIAEGYALRSPRRLRNHLTIAYGSAVETLDLLELLEETNLVPDGLAKQASAHTREAQALLMGLLKSQGRR